MKENFNEIKENVNNLLVAFDKLPEDERKMQFAKQVIAEIVIKKMIDRTQQTTKEEFLGALADHEFVKDVFVIMQMYMEAGLVFGWARLKGDEDGK